MRLFLVSLFVGMSILICTTHTTYAAVSLRTSSINTINSLAVQGTSTQTVIIHPLHKSPIALFSIPFSLQAFGSSATIPAKVTRDTGILPSDTLGFIIESRDGKKVESGIALGTLIMDSATNTAHSILLSEGGKKTFTFLVAFTDTPVLDRQDRVRITHMPLLLDTTGKTIFLNQSELSRLQTGYVELYSH